jgi:hypothetical protein
VAREDMVVSHVGFRVNGVTASPTAEVRIETLDASGMPSGTLWGTNTNGTTGTLTSNSYNLQALTASATISKGQAFFVKIAYASGTSFVLAQMGGWPLYYNSTLPYTVVNTGTPTKSILNVMATIALGSSSTTFYQVLGTMPVTAFTANSFSTSTAAGSKRGMRFTMPYRARCIGLRYWNGGASGDCNVILMDDSGNELSSSSTAYDGDINVTGSNNGSLILFFDNTVTLTAGTTYRVVVEPTTTTNVTVGTLTLPSASYRSASPSGTMAHFTTYTTAGGWVDTATDQIVGIDILIDQIDDGAGSGGGGQRVFGG